MQPFLIIVSRVISYRNRGHSIFSSHRESSDRVRGVDTRTSDFSFALEVALAWVGQLEAELDFLNKPAVLAQSVKSVLGEVGLILLELSNQETMVLYNGFEIPDALLENLVQSNGFYGTLARIRFSKFYEADSTELVALNSTGHPRIESLVAVPVFFESAPSGCLAAASTTGRGRFDPAHAMVLSLAGSVFSLARELEVLRHT